MSPLGWRVGAAADHQQEGGTVAELLGQAAVVLVAAAEEQAVPGPVEIQALVPQAEVPL